MTWTPILEACIETVDEALESCRNGAHQLEICSNLCEDGLTPAYELVKEICSRVRIPCKVMIRSRAGNFNYNNEEIMAMISEIQMLKALPIDGFVFGALRTDESGKTALDTNSIYQICKAAFPIHVTIHKAIDACDEIEKQVKWLKQIFNVKYILSSGGQETAIQGAKMLKKMQKVAGNSIHIIGAGKVTPSNINDIKKVTHLKYFHGRKIVSA